MSDAAHNKSFGQGLTAINEVRKRIYNILDDIFVFFCRSDLRIEAQTGYKNMICQGCFPGYEIFPGYGKFYDTKGLV